jgi:hypothetical protein
VCVCVCAVHADPTDKGSARTTARRSSFLSATSFSSTTHLICERNEGKLNPFSLTFGEPRGAEGCCPFIPPFPSSTISPLLRSTVSVLCAPLDLLPCSSFCYFFSQPSFPHPFFLFCLLLR